MAFLINGSAVVDNSRSIDAIGISTFVDINNTGVTTTAQLVVTGVSTHKAEAEFELGINLTGASSNIISENGNITLTNGQFLGDGSQLTGVLAIDGGGESTFNGTLNLDVLKSVDVEVSSAATFSAAGVGIATFADAGIELNRDVEAPNSAFNVKSVTSAEAMTVTTGGLSITAGDITATTSAVNAASGDFSGALSGDEITADTGFTIGAQRITEISIDGTMTDDSDLAVPTEKAVKAYVDSFTSGGGGSIDADDVVANTVTAKTTLTVGEGTVGTDALAVNGSTGDLQGTTANFSGQLDAGTAVVTGSAQVGSLTFNGTDSANELFRSVAGGGVALDGTATDAQLPTAKAVYDYVDGAVNAQNNLMFSADSGANGDIDLAVSEVLDFQGTANEIVTSSNGNDQVTFSLDADVKVATSFLVGETAGQTGAALLNVSGSGATSKVTLDSDLEIIGSAPLGAGVPLLSVEDATSTIRMGANLEVEGNVNSKSDERLKENIEVIPNALEKVAALRGVSYDWKQSGLKSAGIIAQEVQAVMPELVKEDEYLSVQYNGLIGLLIEATKEQSARIAELEAKLG